MTKQAPNDMDDSALAPNGLLKEDKIHRDPIAGLIVVIELTDEIFAQLLSLAILAVWLHALS
jgi:hypothetical protein